MSATPGPLAAALSKIAAGLSTDLSKLPLSAAFREKYELQRLLACGGMGAVFLAHQRQLARPVAIKFLVTDADVMRARFRREANLLASISHPHVLRLLDNGDEDGLPYHAFEYLPGGTLATFVSKRLKLSPADAVEIALQCLSGLAALHARGIVHRDLKPENVLFADDRQIRIADLGIARDETATAGLTRDGALLGTPRYMSPEQARGEPAGEPADLYAMGCLLYYMLAGEPPFSGGDPVTLLRQHILEKPRPLEQVVSGVPPRVAEVVHQALAKAPEARPASARAFALALEGRVPPKRNTAGHPRRGVRRLAALVVGTLALATLVGALVLLSLPRADRWVAVPASASAAPPDDPAEAIRADVRATDLRLHRDSRPPSELATSPVMVEHRGIVRELLGRLRARLGPRCGGYLSPYQTEVAVVDVSARGADMRQILEESLMSMLLSQRNPTDRPDFIRRRTEEFDEFTRDLRDIAPAVLRKGAQARVRARFAQAAMIPLRPTFQILDMRIRNRHDDEIRRWMKENPAQFVGWYVESERLQFEHTWDEQTRVLDHAMGALEAEWTPGGPALERRSLVHVWADVISRQSRNTQRTLDRDRCVTLLAHLRAYEPKAIEVDPALHKYLADPAGELERGTRGIFSR